MIALERIASLCNACYENAATFLLSIGTIQTKLCDGCAEELAGELAKAGVHNDAVQGRPNVPLPAEHAVVVDVSRHLGSFGALASVVVHLRDGHGIGHARMLRDPDAEHRRLHGFDE